MVGWVTDLFKSKQTYEFKGLIKAEKDTTSELTMLMYYTVLAAAMIAALYVALQNGVYVLEPAQQFRGF